MMLGVQKRLSAGILGCSKDRVLFDTERLAEIKEAITKADLRVLIDQGAIRRLPARGISGARIRFVRQQKGKNKRKGHGSRKGAAGARTVRKTVWVNKVRLQRSYLKRLRFENKVKGGEFSELYGKIKGGFFRSKRHMELYLTEQGILKTAKLPQQQQRGKSENQAGGKV
ncbi:50S ribosomal protein L19e [Candidatus Woesearchaeota archaeon]|nr:50S ribosomal protein L19e [Candidatus Woesearchaeota archaeon]